ncbi:MAG: glycosyltransferase [Cyclobacteriaceae bacterium]
MKVLHIIKSLGRGGAETLLPETLKEHDLSRFEFHYIYFLPWKNQMVDPIQSGGGVVTCMSASGNLAILLRIGKVKQYILTNKIDLIHCHLPWAGLVGRVLQMNMRVPVLYTEHNKQERYHMVTRWLNRITFNWQSAVISVSNDVTQSIRSNVKVNIPLYDIPNGVNTEYFQCDSEMGMRVRSELGIPPQALVVGNVAVFRVQKRLKEWIDIFSKSSKKHLDLHGILVGDGPLKDDLVGHIRSLGLEDRIHLVGLRTDVRPWVSAMNIFMISSEFEGLPLALLEAMSMKCAIVATDAGGIKQVLKNDIDGLLTPVDQWQLLETKLNELILQPEKIAKLGDAARRKVIEEYGVSKMVVALERLYTNITKQSGANDH